MATKEYQLLFQQGPLAGRLVVQARLDSVFTDTLRDYRSGGVLNAAQGLVRRFHINNFDLARIPTQ